MKSIHILLIEDNEGDIMLTTEALEDSRIVNNISVIKDGRAAIDFFEKMSTNAIDQRSIPDLVLLDINLPKKSGHEVLYYLKHNEKYQHIPVIMLTTSSSENDVTRSYKNYVNCYITKPIEAADFMNAVAKIEDFWINIVTIPK